MSTTANGCMLKIGSSSSMKVIDMRQKGYEPSMVLGKVNKGLDLPYDSTADIFKVLLRKPQGGVVPLVVCCLPLELQKGKRLNKIASLLLGRTVRGSVYLGSGYWDPYDRQTCQLYPNPYWYDFEAGEVLSILSSGMVEVVKS